MNIHEYQAKEILRSYGVIVPRGHVVTSPKEAVDRARQLGGELWVVKAQIHAGGRGKGGGIRFARSLEEVKEHASALLGHTLITPQTGSKGQVIRKIYIEEGIAVERQIYFGLLIERQSRCIMAITSTEGGMEIEEVAQHNPQALLKIPLDALIGAQPFHARKFAYHLGLEGSINAEAIQFFMAISRAFRDLDASLIEINPLVVTKAGQLVALDAKMIFDDNALFRQPEIKNLRDETEEDPAEVRASLHDLSYIKLEGNIGCMVNGAGLAMATMDEIQLQGGMPANFLDVGGGADRERVRVAFELILSDPNVKAVLVNIFGGIMRCDIIAEGIIAAARQMSVAVPLVVRLEGTNYEQGMQILKQSGLKIIAAQGLKEAASRAVQAAKEAA